MNINCEHEKLFPMPDSLAEVCEKCGQVFICGEQWNYKSGNIIEWIKDMSEAAEKRDGK